MEEFRLETQPSLSELQSVTSTISHQSSPSQVSTSPYSVTSREVPSSGESQQLTWTTRHTTRSLTHLPTTLVRSMFIQRLGKYQQQKFSRSSTLQAFILVRVQSIAGRHFSELWRTLLCTFLKITTKSRVWSFPMTLTTRSMSP